MTPLQRLSTLPDAFFGFSRAAAIAISPDRRGLHATNRGHDSIARFEVDQSSGQLTFEGATSCAGRTTRFCGRSPDGTGLITANEASDTIVRLALDATASGAIEVAAAGSPVCALVFEPS